MGLGLCCGSTGSSLRPVKVRSVFQKEAVYSVGQGDGSSVSVNEDKSTGRANGERRGWQPEGTMGGGDLRIQRRKDRKAERWGILVS